MQCQISINDRPPNANQILFKKSAKIAHGSQYLLVINQPFVNFLIKNTVIQLLTILGKDVGVWQKIDNRHSSKSIPTVVTR